MRRVTDPSGVASAPARRDPPASGLGHRVALTTLRLDRDRAADCFSSEFAITVSDGAVWLAIAQGLLFGAVCLLFGIWVARSVGLLASDAPAGETLGVGLASGLMVLAAWWAAIWSGGRSSFTPVAIGFAIAIGLAVARRLRPETDADARRRGRRTP